MNDLERRFQRYKATRYFLKGSYQVTDGWVPSVTVMTRGINPTDDDVGTELFAPLRKAYMAKTEADVVALQMGLTWLETCSPIWDSNGEILTPRDTVLPKTCS